MADSEFAGILVSGNVGVTGTTSLGDLVNISGPTPELFIIDTDAGADSGKWVISLSNTTFVIRTVNDANDAESKAIEMTRSANVVTQVDLITGGTARLTVNSSGEIVITGDAALTSGSATMVIGAAAPQDSVHALEIVRDAAASCELGIHMSGTKTGDEEAIINFGDDGSRIIGRFLYRHKSGEEGFRFRVEGVDDRLVINSAGDGIFAGDMTQKITASDVSNPPTDAELDALFTSPATQGDGWTAYVQDNSGSVILYQVVASGAVWHTFTSVAAA